MTGFDGYAAELLRDWWPGCSLVVERSVDSTNRLARSIIAHVGADAGRPGPTWIVAWEQSAGRGRQGRSWRSEPGNGIYASLIHPVQGRPSEQLLALPLAVGVGACRALEPRSADPLVALKWPNDLLVHGRKLAGILIEVVDAGEAGPCAVIGIGVNHGHSADTLPDPNATSLRLVHEEAGTPLPPLHEVVAVLCRTIAEQVAADAPMADVLEEYRQLSVHVRGDRLTWHASDGQVEGVFEGFDDNGCILLRTAEGVVNVSSGDVLIHHRL